MTRTFYTTDFKPVQPTQAVAFCAAKNPADARYKLWVGLAAVGIQVALAGFRIQELKPTDPAIVLNGDY